MVHTKFLIQAYDETHKFGESGQTLYILKSFTGHGLIGASDRDKLVDYLTENGGSEMQLSAENENPHSSMNFRGEGTQSKILDSKDLTALLADAYAKRKSEVKE